MINILIRTSNRPLYFYDCIRSIESQSCNDYRIVVGNDARDFYLQQYNPIRYEMLKSNKRHLILSKGIKARHFPVNLYLNQLMATVHEGWVMILDDDDMFVSQDAIKKITSVCKSEETAVFWRVKIGDRIVPKKFGRPKVKDFSMIGMCFHSKYIPLLQFDEFKQTDYRVADRIFSILDVVYIDEVLTGTQHTGDGFGLRKDKSYVKK